MRGEHEINSKNPRAGLRDSPLIYLTAILVLLSTCCPGCIQVPNISGGEITDQEITPIPAEDFIPIESFPTEIPIITPESTPTPLISTVADWNPYVIIPIPEEVSNNKRLLKERPSVLKNGDINNRHLLNVTYSGSADLTGYAYGKELNITKGPFSITYTVHPKISNPVLVWVKLTILDTWQKITAEEGYNREYSSDGTKTMTIYREGRYYLIIDGEYATVDYTLKTGDPTPEPTPIPEPIEEEY